LVDVFNDNTEIQQLYIDSIDLAVKSMILTKRIDRYKYVICKFVAVASYIETSNGNINDTWHGMLKTIGVLSEQFDSSIESWTLEDSYIETTRIFKFITKESIRFNQFNNLPFMMT